MTAKRSEFTVLKKVLYERPIFRMKQFLTTSKADKFENQNYLSLLVVFWRVKNKI